MVETAEKLSHDSEKTKESIRVKDKQKLGRLFDPGNTG